MSKKMLINASHPEENRVAIVVDGILNDLDIEIAGQEQSKGNIYKAVVVRVETGLQAAFVDYGAEKLGFLQIGEIHPSFYPARDESKGRPRIADILKRGQEILVQIVKEERGSKGAALTTFLSIPGRYMVLMPDSTTKGVSRKISEDSERKKLKKTMAELDLPERMGYIVRTAGIGKDKEELKRDFDYLVRLFEGITARKDKIKAPAQLYQESNLAIRSIRDYFSTDMDEVLIDDATVYRDAKDFFALVMPELCGLVKQHRERRPIFSRYQIEEQIDGLSKNQIPMASGGSIVIDQTEALVAIDVNSGKMASESGIEATALKTNVEAASEVGRQLRLRDLGGLIVIDFIDMRDRKNIREVEQALRKALKDDKAKVSVGRISQFGLLEMSRQRLKPVLSVGSFLECPHCHGIGRVKSVEAQGIALLRQVHTVACKGQISGIEAKVPQEVANYLLNQKRATINELERQLGLTVSIFGSSGMLPGDIELDIRKKSKDSDSGEKIVPISHANQIEVALAAQQENQESQETAQTEAGESPQAEQEATPEQPKKRRRRRRKKPAQTEKSGQDEAAATAATATAKPGDSGQEQEAQTQAAASAGQSSTSEQQETAAGETASTTAVEEAQTPATESTQEKKTSRRGRRPARQRSAPPSGTSSASETSDTAESKNTQESQGDTTGKESLQGEQQPATESAASSSSKSSDNTPKKTSRSRRPARTKKVDPAHNGADQADSAALAPVALEKKEATSESATEDASKAAKKKTPARPRRSSRKKETSLPAEAEQAPGQAQDGQAVASSQEQPPQDGSTEKHPAKNTRSAPQRRSRKTSAPSAAKEENASPAPEMEVTAAEKPKRRTRQTAGKTTAASTKTAAARKTSDDSAVTKETTASKPRRTSRKKFDETQQNADETAPALKPQRRTRKKVDAPEQQPAENSSVPASTDESKPKRKPRSASRKKSEQDQATPTEPASE